MLITEKHTLVNVKKYLKELATAIRISKQLRKTTHCNLAPFDAIVVAQVKQGPRLWALRNAFRHYHIAYCEFRGKDREQIEFKCDSSPNEDTIYIIKAQIKRDMEEHYEKQTTVCASA